jgi:hypothetical protein
MRAFSASREPHWAGGQLAPEQSWSLEAGGLAGVGPHSGDGVDGVQELDGVHGDLRSEAKCLAPVGAGAEPPLGVDDEMKPRRKAGSLGGPADTLPPQVVSNWTPRELAICLRNS